MREYWKSGLRTSGPTPGTTPTGISPATPHDGSILSEYDRHRLSLITQDTEEGWQSELRRYLKDMPADVSRDTDIVTWWQDHCDVYPTLARIALDVLPAQASSVPCERLFSSSKQVADDRRARLGAKRFEELQLMKFAWRQNITDLVAWNSGIVEEVDLDLYQDMLMADKIEDELDVVLIDD